MGEIEIERKEATAQPFGFVAFVEWLPKFGNCRLTSANKPVSLCWYKHAFAHVPNTYRKQSLQERTVATLRKGAISRLEKCTEFSVCVIPSIPGTCQSLYEADHNIGWRIQEAVWIVIRIRRSSALLLLIIQREHHNFVVHLSVVVVEKRFVRTRSRLLRSVGSILPKDQGVDDYGNCSPNSRTLGSNKSVSSAATANKGTGRI